MQKENEDKKLKYQNTLDLLRYVCLGIDIIALFIGFSVLISIFELILLNFIKDEKIYNLINKYDWIIISILVLIFLIKNVTKLNLHGLYKESMIKIDKEYIKKANYRFGIYYITFVAIIDTIIYSLIVPNLLRLMTNFNLFLIKMMIKK
ncbi:MAG: hypothetical protein WH035_06370 [Spirochaetota bacterium]